MGGEDNITAGQVVNFMKAAVRDRQQNPHAVEGDKVAEYLVSEVSPCIEFLKGYIAEKTSGNEKEDEANTPKLREYKQGSHKCKAPRYGEQQKGEQR